MAAGLLGVQPVPPLTHPHPTPLNTPGGGLGGGGGKDKGAPCTTAHTARHAESGFYENKYVHVYIRRIRII